MRLIGLRCTTQTAKGVKHENGKETERKKKELSGKDSMWPRLHEYPLWPLIPGPSTSTA